MPSIIPSKLVLVHRPVYHTMMDFARQHLDREVIGIFFGKINEIQDLEIFEAYPFRVGERTDVEFIDEDYERAAPLIQECEKRGLIWCGWFHSHPFYQGDHLYLSSKDISYHLPVQESNPFWTAIVINPYQVNKTGAFDGIKAFRVQTKKRSLFSNPIQVLTIQYI